MHHSKINRPLRRTAALLCAALAGLGLAGRAAAQTATGPLTTPYTSPPQPTPFQWPLYHSGGGPVPTTGATAQYPVDTTSAPYLTPLLDPLQGQLQGTPTELYNGSLTQIPSYLLGNYDPTRPPQGLSGGINIYYPNHFADGGIYSWSAPFSYVSQSIGSVTVDDNAAAPILTGTVATNSGFTSSGFTSITTGLTNPSFPAAGTATNSEYLRLASGTPGSAVWTLYEATAGNYSLYFHIPNDLPDSNGNPETRDTQVIYFITVRDANGNVTNTTSATASQTEANDSQFLAGPFQVVSGGTVTVTLTRNNTTNNNADYLVADSMTLQATVGDVQSAPTAITRAMYPLDFQSTDPTGHPTGHPLQYWGIYVPPTASIAAGVQQTVGTTAAVNANPDTNVVGGGTAANNGNILLKSGNQGAALDMNGAQDPYRLIRQLVYFGRSDPAASISSSVDDNSTSFIGGGTTVINTVLAPNASAATASNNEYRRINAAAGPVPTITSAAAATWTVPVPTASVGTSFFVYAHIPANLTTPAETRLNQVYYSVTTSAGTYGPVAISQITQGTDALVALPTGALTAASSTNIVVRLYSANTTATTNAVVVADSVTVSTGTGQGAIYCVDGFTGGVVWRYETPGSANGSSAPVFASPAIVKINVLVTPASGTTPAVYANRLVAIVGDNNGLVYCLDAIGNGDGTSNVNVLAKDTNGNPIPGDPVTIPQPAYGGTVTPLAAGTPATTAALTAHVGTTGVYWIYRPDASQPKYVTGSNVGTVKPIDPTSDLPVPAAFNTASPNIFVDPTVSTTPDTTTGALASNAKVYIGNSNGVLYALDALGAPIDGTTKATFAKTGDTFNVSQDLQGGVSPVIPSAQPLWWFSLRGADPNSASNASSADIESAPAVYVKATTTTTPVTYTPTVYIGSAHEMETTSNVGRLYALNGLSGPSGNNGRAPSDPTATGHALPGSFNYNIGQIPQTSKTDTADWSFPDANTTVTGTLAGFAHTSSNGKARPALGNITGSPVVFTNIDETTTASHQTRIYIAANSGYEATATTLNPTARPDDTTTGRLWAVNLDGSVGTSTNRTTDVWAYPVAKDPNNAALDGTAEPAPPIGSFLRATPAIGFVQFPATIFNGDGSRYNPADAVHGGIANGTTGATVPMLYVGTRGVNDTALYAVDIDGDMTTPGTATTSSGTLSSDSRTIYRVVSPDGSIFQSSPALVANATSAGGNGGGVYIVAGNTLYDYSATPISNPFAGQFYPLIRENKAYTGFGPISSPAIAGADTSDISTAFLTGGNTGVGSNQSGFKKNTTDWIYVGDSSSGLCRGITPNDTSYGGIPDLGVILPPTLNPPPAPLLNAFIQTFLTPNQTDVVNPSAYLVGATAPLPVYEWGESAFARFSNVAPPNPILAATGKPDPKLFVHDTQVYTAADLANAATTPVPFYTSDGTTAQTVTFNLADADNTTSGGLVLDNGSVQPVVITTPPDGFIAYSTTAPLPSFFANVVTNLVANDGNRYVGTYTYTIADGTARSNTPGARRRFQNVKQTVTEWDYKGDGTAASLADPNQYEEKGTVIISGDATNENLVTSKLIDGSYGFNTNSLIAAIDQPTFGILNPLGVRGGGVSLRGGSTAAVVVGDELGPFRGVPATFTSSEPQPNRQALTNGNDVPNAVPPSSSGVGGSPITLKYAASASTDATATTTSVVVTATGLIPHNSSGSNAELTPTAAPSGTSGSGDGLTTTSFGGYGLDVFDRGALYNLGQSLRLKMGVQATNSFASPSSHDGIYWNSNVVNDTTGHGSVVNFLPWEVPPTPYVIGNNGNGSQDYPDIAPGNITQNAQPVNGSTGGDLTSNNVTLPVGIKGGGTGTAAIHARTVTGDPVQVQIRVPPYQPANQQLYQQTSGDSYNSGGTNHEIAPVDASGTSQITKLQVFPMGYVTVKRLFVPGPNGFYTSNRPYRDVRIYTGVPIDMRTSIVTPSADIGKVPAAFGVQTESDTNYSFFTPYTPAFQSYFKPLEIHNDGNVNLLNVHMDQKYTNINNGGTNSLLLSSDAVDPLSLLTGYDFAPPSGSSGVTGPRTLPELPYLIRSPIDTDLVNAYGRNPYIINNFSATYPGATFHKPRAGGSQPSTLTVPDVPESYVPGASLNNSPDGLPKLPTVVDTTNNNLPYTAPPFVSLAVPFGTPVGTYSTPVPSDPTSLRLFEGIDVGNTATAAYNLNPGTGSIPNYLYPPKYNGAVGGISAPSSSNLNDVYTFGEPLSTTGTQLIGTVVEQRLTDGSTYGAVPMIDGGPAKTVSATTTSTPDFAPAAFRDLATGNLSVYWTSGRGSGYGIYGANLPFVPDPPSNTTGLGYFLPTDPTGKWWKLIPSLSAGLASGTNSGLSITPGNGTNYAFDVAVMTAPYSNTLYSYTVTPGTGVLGTGAAITPASDASQVKYGVKGLYTGSSFTNPLWAFWTASTRGRTAIYYNSQTANSTGDWPLTTSLLPIPAGLTAVADASPMLMSAPVSGSLASTMEVTYSGTAPDGNVDLYVSRYVPDGTTATTASKLDLVPFPAVTENLRAVGGWYQARDVAWSRTGALNVYVNGTSNPILYDAANKPLFSKAIYDKASGLLVLTGVKVPSGAQTTTTNTVYVDAATGRVRFSPALLTATTQNFPVQATFSPLARRLTLDSRADTAPVTFLDDKNKPNDGPGLAPVTADRRWTIWRKAGTSGDTSSATLYYKTQRLTFFLPTAIDPTKAITISLGGASYTLPVDVDYERGRLYFPISSGAEGETATVTYTAPGTTSQTRTPTTPDPNDTIQWQDEPLANDPLANDNAVPPANSAAGLDTVIDTKVPIDTAVNENNVAAFLDPFAGVSSSHKVWLFWNSTRNGTADIYSETIDPRFAPG